MSSTCWVDTAPETILDAEKWVFRSGSRTSGPSNAARRLRLRSRANRPTLRLAEVPEYGSGDAELSDDLERTAAATWS